MNSDDIADKIGNYFASISQEFSPDDVEKIPSKVKKEILNCKVEDVPHISFDMVVDLISQVRKSRKPTTREIPPFLFKETLVTVKYPISHLFNLIVWSRTWPSR